MKIASSSFLALGLFALPAAGLSSALIACSSSSSSPATNSPATDGGTGTTGTSAPSCATACSHAVAACSELPADQCTSACASATSSQISCLAAATSCDAIQACESSSGSSSSGGDEDSGSGSGGTMGSGDDAGGGGGGGTMAGDDGGCDTFAEETYTFTLATGFDWSKVDVDVNAQAYDSTGKEGDVMGGILSHAGSTMTYSFKAYGCTPKVNVTIDYAVVGGTSCTGGPVDLTENAITVAAPTVDTTQESCTAPTPM